MLASQSARQDTLAFRVTSLEEQTTYRLTSGHRGFLLCILSGLPQMARLNSQNNLRHKQLQQSNQNNMKPKQLLLCTQCKLLHNSSTLVSSLYHSNKQATLSTTSKRYKQKKLQLVTTNNTTTTKCKDSRATTIQQANVSTCENMSRKNPYEIRHNTRYVSEVWLLFDNLCLYRAESPTNQA